MRLFRSATLLLIALFSLNNPCVASEMDDRRQIGRAVQDAFAHERFAEIDDLAERYRAGKVRTDSGLWKLTLVYASISQAISNETQEGEVAPAFRAIEKRIQRWMTLQPNSPTARLAYAHALTGHAWAISSRSVGPDMTPQEWASFHALFEEARIYLEKNKSVAAVDPHWYELMLVVGRVQSWDAKKFRAMFDAAIAREPLFYQTWFVAVDYFLPQWLGKVDDVEAFAQLGVTKTAASEGTAMYARIYWYASQSEFGDNLFKDSLANWPKMKAGFDAMLARYPDPWNLNTYGKFACLAKDKKSTREFFTRIGSQPLYQAWTTRAQVDACRTWAMAGT